MSAGEHVATVPAVVRERPLAREPWARAAWKSSRDVVIVVVNLAIFFTL